MCWQSKGTSWKDTNISHVIVSFVNVQPWLSQCSLLERCKAVVHEETLPAEPNCGSPYPGSATTVVVDVTGREAAALNGIDDGLGGHAIDNLGSCQGLSFSNCNEPLKRTGYGKMRTEVDQGKCMEPCLKGATN